MGAPSYKSERCPRCRLQLQNCICALIPELKLATRLVLVMHHRECAKTTATGPLALEAMPNSELKIQGMKGEPLDLTDLNDPRRRLLLLYPGDDVSCLTSTFIEKDPRPITLVVPDGTWTQTGKMARRIPGLDQAEKIKLPTGRPSEWFIRKTVHPFALSTYEAIARAMGVIEGQAVQEKLEALFHVMVERTLKSKGIRPNASSSLKTH